MKIDNEIKEDLVKYINSIKLNIKNTTKAIEKLESILFAYSHEPCLICKRRVQHPCNTVDNRMESGPWDYSCDAHIWPERFEDD